MTYLHISHLEALLDPCRKQPTSFASFIKAEEPPSGDAHEEARQEAAEQSQPRPRADQAVVTILYGTEYGFSQEVAEKLQLQLQAHAHLWCATFGDTLVHISPFLLPPQYSSSTMVWKI